MRTPRLYIDAPLAEGQVLSLDRAHTHRLIRVMRMRRGQDVLLFDGTGQEYQARIGATHRHSLCVELRGRCDRDRESPLPLTLALATAGSRSVDMALQKAVELGVQRCELIYTEYSQNYHEAKTWKAREAHWKRLIISATEQCGRTRLCTLHPPQRFPDWLQRHRNERAVSLFLDPHWGTFPLPERIDSGTSLAVIIGPEGGFSDSEYRLARDNGCIAISLGPRILRTETAAITAVGLCQARYGDYCS